MAIELTLGLIEAVVGSKLEISLKMKKHIAILFLLATFSLSSTNLNEPQTGLVAIYHFDEGSGDRVSDSSGKKKDGAIVEAAKWVDGIKGKALLFDGLNRIRIPASPQLDLKDQVSVGAWIKGVGGNYRISEEHPFRRSPYFQVCGDRIYFATNSDQFSLEQKAEIQKVADSAGKKTIDWDLFTDVWHLWTGTVDINLTSWAEKKRTEAPFSCLEPKLQVVGNKIYYEYFGQDKNRVWQIWTAQSNIDGSGWETMQRTSQREGLGVEQAFNIQVVKDRIYYAYPQKDEKNEWQLWTASSNLDGSDFRAVQRTTKGGWIPYFQVVGDKIYYSYATVNEVGPSQKKNLRNKLFFAELGIDGTGWKVIKTINDVGYWYAFFQIHNSKFYLMYSGLDRNNLPHLFTGHMDLEGLNFQAVQRTFGSQTAEPSLSGIQVVGNRIYYTFQTRETDKLDFNVHLGKRGVTLWTAESNFDGSDWKAVRRTTAPPDVYGNFKAVQVVGGKLYGTLMVGYSNTDVRGRLQTSGSNIINKGDAYGIGVTEDQKARGFINAGQDYLFRAETPSDTAGAIADHLIDNNWHYLVMTYDRKTLRLYIDGGLKASTPYNAAIGSNPFPLLIGDGFRGIIDEVAIYNRVLSPAEISARIANGNTRSGPSRSTEQVCLR